MIGKDRKSEIFWTSWKYSILNSIAELSDEWYTNVQDQTGAKGFFLK